MKYAMKALIASAALSTALCAGAASASEPFSTLRASANNQFSTLGNIQAETISPNELAMVEGKLVLNLSNVLGSRSVVVLLEPHNLLAVQLLGLTLGGAPSSTVGVLGIDVLGLKL